MTPLPPAVTFDANDGTTRTIELTGVWTRDIRSALDIDYPSDPSYIDRGSDIAVALDEGYVLTAAYLLTGATETPALGAVQTAYADSVGIPEDGALIDFPAVERDGWFDFHDRMARRCPACNSVTYAADLQEPEQCANCRASIMRDYVFVAVIPYKSNREPSLAYDEFTEAGEIDFDTLLFFGGAYNATPEMIHDANYGVTLTYQGRELDIAEDDS